MIDWKQQQYLPSQNWSADNIYWQQVWLLSSSEPCEQLLAKVYFWGFIFTIDQVQCSRSIQNVKVTPECLWKQKWGFGFPRRIEEVRVIKKTKQQILNLTPPPPCWHLRRSSVHVSGLATVSSIWPMKSHSHVISV